MTLDESASRAAILRTIGVTVATTALTALGFELLTGARVSEPVWPVMGLATGAILCGGMRRGREVVVGLIAGGAVAGVPPTIILVFTLATCASALLARALLPRNFFDPALQRVDDTVRLIVIGGGVSALAFAALMLCLALYAAWRGGLPDAPWLLLDPLSAAMSGWFGAATSSLIMAPATLGLLGRRRASAPPLKSDRAGLLLGVVSTALAGYLVPTFRDPVWVGPWLLFLFAPGFLWASLRSGPFGVAMLAAAGGLAILVAALLHPPEQGLANMVAWATLAGFVAGSLLLASALASRRELDREFQDVFENSEDFIWIMDGKGRRFLRASPGYERIWQQPVAELMTNPTSWRDAILAEDRTRIELELNQRLRGSFSAEYRILRADGEERWVSGRSSTVLNDDGSTRHIIGVSRDVTAYKRIEFELRESRRLLQKAQSAGRIGTWISETYPVGRLLWSEQTCRIFGIDPETFDNDIATFRSIVHPEDLGFVSSAAEAAIRDGTPYDVEHRIVRPDGETRWVRESADVDHDEASGAVRLVGVVRDVTEYRLLENQLLQAQKMEAIGTLAGGIAHDFNNILTALSGNLELARASVDEHGEAVQYLIETERAAARARDLVRQILTFSRQQPQVRSVVRLQPVLDEAVNLLRATLPATVDLVTRIEDSSDTVLADTTQIHQIAMNLCTNAWHALPEGAGRIELDYQVVRMNAGALKSAPDLPAGNYARLRVRDDGVGMSRAMQAKVFEPFFTTKDTGAGTGLGLSVVLGIVQTHGGALELDSSVGEGSCFSIYLPVTESLAPQAARARPRTTSGSGQRILFVDDEPQIAALARRAMKRRGFDLITVERPSEALSLLTAESEPFDLLVTDMNMPGMSGLALVRELREIHPDFPVLLTTGNATSDMEDQFRELGVERILLKPYSMDDLAHAIATVLRT